MRNRIVRPAEMHEIDGLSKSTRARLIKAGKYPKPVRLSARNVGFRLCEVEEWINSLESVAGGDVNATAQN
jgi:predicted DNA-binding transcriptional regulator AlpA